MPASWAAFTASATNLPRAFGERGEDAARVQPANALLFEELLPIHVARFHAGGGRVAAVVERDRCRASNDRLR